MSTSYGLRSTGLLVFAARIISAFTGLLFTVMVARWLSPAGLGTWEVIVTLVTFSAYPVGFVAFWATRDVARGQMVGRTAFWAGALLSSLGLALYFGFTVFTYSRIAASIIPFLLGAFLVPLSYWSAVANSIVQGFRPGAYGYSLVISEIAKLAVAYDALYVYRLGIEGVILALITSYFVQSAVGTYLVRLTASEGFETSQIRRWLRIAWLPAVSYLPTVLAVADTFVAAVGFGPQIVGYYQVAFIVASVVGYSSSLAYSLYPLLLRGGNERLPAVSMEFSLLFAIPMAAGCIALAGPILFLFRSMYLASSAGLAILASMFIFTVISGIVDQALQGTEKADIGQRPDFWALIRSNLLFVPVANVLYGAFYVTTLYLALSFASSSGFSISSTIELWATVQLAATVIFMLVKARRARRVAKLLPGISVAYYLLAAVVMSVVVYLVSGPLVPQGIGTLSYGGRLLGVGILGAAVYFGIVYALDSKFRDLALRLWKRF
jgi:O-antigen/teichoic acid export membrane protein